MFNIGLIENETPQDKITQKTKVTRLIVCLLMKDIFGGIFY